MTAWNTLHYSELRALAEEYGTPFYLYDVGAIRDRIKQTRKHFLGQLNVYYAVKANPNREILQRILGEADGFDISSGGELEQLRLLGAPMDQLSFAGPAKTEGELIAAVEHGIGCISLESIHELERVVGIARSFNQRAKVSLRLNPTFLNRKFGIKMGGKAVQFGFEQEEIGKICAVVASQQDCLDFQGIHIYAGSQCFEPEGIVAGIQNSLDVVRELELSAGLFCQKINLGGGFGVSHGVEDRELDVAHTAQLLNPVIDEFRAASERSREIILELGRYLTAVAGIYVTRVISQKESRGKFFYMADGGLNHHLSAAGTFGATLRSNFPVVNLTATESQKVKCTIAGPSCNPTDLLGVDVTLSRPNIGDLLGIPKSGSYGLTASPLLFLGRDTPVELVRDGDSVVVGRRAYSMQDFN